ncbi:hypothetical protein XENOCAPTIV_005374, partial [Xenoophorus captivus]
SLLKNVAHMTTVHSFFIPDVEFLVNLKGLIRYLGEKVGAGNVCLWCNEKGRSFYSTEAVQSHMIDKSHCAKIGHRSLMRYYKQRFGMQRTVVLSHSRNAVGRVLRQYKALGWTGDAETRFTHVDLNFFIPVFLPSYVRFVNDSEPRADDVMEKGWASSRDADPPHCCHINELSYSICLWSSPLSLAAAPLPFAGPECVCGRMVSEV